VKYIKAQKKWTVRLKHWLSMPFIWLMFFPVLGMDISLEIYHRICFPLYNIPYVKRSEYIRVDRYKLKYLSLFQKLSCAYCGYANGVFAYVSEIGARTEEYWCGVQHAKERKFVEPKHHENFLPYGDEEAFNTEYACDLGKK